MKIKIGITGVGIELNGLVPESLYGNTKYLDPVQNANTIASKLKKGGVFYMIEFHA